MINHTLELSLDDDRHLVVGDLHGRYEVFMRLLDKANYDPAKDIIYSVGDMIDRGPDSVKCVEFFHQDRCYAIKGNHEHMMLTNEWRETWVANGGIECMDSVHAAGRDEGWLKDMVRDFPWVIDVGDNDEEHAFRVVHAEMPSAWSESYFQRILNEAINGSDPGFARLIWSRTLVADAVENISRMRPAHYEIEFHPDRFRNVFTGHTPVHNIIKCGDTWMLDTWRSKSLSMIDAVSKEKFVAYY